MGARGRSQLQEYPKGTTSKEDFIGRLLQEMKLREIFSVGDEVAHCPDYMFVLIASASLIHVHLLCCLAGW